MNSKMIEKLDERCPRYDSGTKKGHQTIDYDQLRAILNADDSPQRVDELERKFEDIFSMKDYITRKLQELQEKDSNTLAELEKRINSLVESDANRELDLFSVKKRYAELEKRVAELERMMNYLDPEMFTKDAPAVCDHIWESKEGHMDYCPKCHSERKPEPKAVSLKIDSITNGKPSICDKLEPKITPDHIARPGAMVDGCKCGSPREACKVHVGMNALCGKLSPEPEKPLRFAVVSDGSEYTVFDNKTRCDLFPTRTENRRYACKYGCSESTAKMIADALNNDYISKHSTKADKDFIKIDRKVAEDWWETYKDSSSSEITMIASRHMKEAIKEALK